MTSDKFYTKEDVVERLCSKTKEIIGNTKLDLIIEPSAGDGAFLNSLKTISSTCDYLAFDIFPENPCVVKQDWLKWEETELVKNKLIIGNPPFGKNASLAVKFFNKAASHRPLYIAFVLPRTFMKQRFWRRLDKNYVIAWQEECPKNSFYYGEEVFDVPCAMQIWKEGKRKDCLPDNLLLFQQVSPSEATCFIRRAGGRAGQIVESFTPSSTYAVKCSYETMERLMEYQSEICKQASLTAGVRSISLFEIEDILLGRGGTDEISV